jgi:hypothetical protein
MIRIKGRGAVYGEFWHDEEPIGDPGVDIAMYRHRSAPIAGARTVPVLSLVHDLSVEADAILSRFDKDCRYLVRRADEKDAPEMAFTVEPAHRLEDFRAFYDAFASEKSLKPCYWQWLVAASEAGQLALTSASLNGEALVWHAYLLSGTTAQLEYSASCFRNKAKDYRSLVGRANRWLHWKDLLRFKEMGFRKYDFGGLFEDESTPERAGINHFKKEFGGRQERMYNCTLPVTVKGRIWLLLRKAWHSGAPSGGTAPQPAASG